MMTQKDLWNMTDLFVIDIDGTFKKGQSLVPGAGEFIRFLREHNKRYIFFTNNSSKSPVTYAREFCEGGCRVGVDEVVSTADVAVFYLNKYYPETRVYLVGTDDFKEYLKCKGINIVEENADVVLVGFDTGFTYEKMKKASTFIRNGAVFLATHLDLNCPVEDGFIPDCGSICASITSSTGVVPVNLGKPCAKAMDAILGRECVSAERVTFVGDRISTDIAIGVRHGANSCLILGGASTKEEADHADTKPDYIFGSLKELFDHLESAAVGGKENAS